VSGFPPEALPFLRCPVCTAAFSPAGNSLQCASGHNYDVARRGYANLLPGGARPGTADSAEMVAAREAFLSAGHFAGLRDFVCMMAERALGVAADDVTASGRGGAGNEASVAGEAPPTAPTGNGARPPMAPTGNGAHPRSAAPSPGCIVEVGAGTGYYLAGMLDRLPGRVGLALDISKFAARRAARAHERMAAVVCDAWQALPLIDGAASLLLDIFAPRNPGEFRRILRPDGVLLVVTPSPRHLRELVDRLDLVTVDAQKPRRLEQALERGFSLNDRAEYEEVLSLPPADAVALVGMGPSARHLQRADITERLDGRDAPTGVTLSVIASMYTPRTPADAPAAAIP
jgi:SAM-dependent methyltransferase